MKKTSLWLGAGSALAMFLAVAQAKVLINGAGATFPDVIYTKWFQEFPKKYPDAQINYQSLGSGAGIRQLTEGTVDFGASDMPMTDAQISKMKVRAPALSDCARRGRADLQCPWRDAGSEVHTLSFGGNLLR